MNKKEFLKGLRKKLKTLKPAEIQKHLNDYEELLSDMMEDGLSEEDAIAEIGTPEQIAGEILDNASTEEYRGRDIAGRVLIGLSVVLGVSAVLVKLWLSRLNGTSVSIIGGADGPTSIFIAGKVGEPTAFYAVAATVITITIIYKVYCRYK